MEVSNVRIGILGSLRPGFSLSLLIRFCYFSAAVELAILRARKISRFRNKEVQMPKRGMSLRRFPAMVALVSISAALIFGCSATNKLPDWMSFSSGATHGAVPIAWETSFERASSDATDSGKILMLWFTGSDWCKYCTLLEQEVFHTATFNDWYGDKIVPVMLDYPRETSLAPELEQQNAALKKKFGQMVTSYPTALFVDSEGQVLGKLGYIEGGAENWIHQAENILTVAW